MKHTNISNRLQNVLSELNNSILAEDMWQILNGQNFDGFLTKLTINYLCKKHRISTEELALMLLPIVASYANPIISNFSVGAITKGESGHFYFGANQEFCTTTIAQTIHAEQSAISHAWMRGEKSITDIYVNYSPCGHCRQFMNELNSASNLLIHLPNELAHNLYHYLPNAFGPKDLKMPILLMDKENNHLSYETTSSLKLAALNAANRSHAPYSKTYCGVAVELKNGNLYSGSYAENAAFNPSLPALQVTLNLVRMHGENLANIQKIVMIEKPTTLSYRHSAEELLKILEIGEFEYIEL